MAWYLYAITEEPLGVAMSGVPGLADRPLETIEAGGVWAVVSQAPPGRPRPERRHLAAHQNVLRRLTETQSLLPVSFGVVFRKRAELTRTLGANAETLRDNLDRVRGRVEMTVRVVWDVPSIFQHFVERWVELRAARDRLVASGAHEDKVEAGRLFERLLTGERERHAAAVAAGLEPWSVEISATTARGEKDVLSLACLVERGSLAGFEDAIGRVAEGFDETFRFEYSGPWAAHSFVRINLAPEDAVSADAEAA